MAYVFSVAPHEQISSYSCFHFTSTDISDFNAQKNVSIKWMTRIQWNAPNRVNILRMYRWKIALFLFIRRSFISLLPLSTGKTAKLIFGMCSQRSEWRPVRVEWGKKNAENSSNGYQSKSKMPKISMKRLRNGHFSCFFFWLRFFTYFTFPVLDFAVWMTLKQFISVLGAIILWLLFISDKWPNKSRRNHFLFQTIWLESTYKAKRSHRKWLASSAIL